MAAAADFYFPTVAAITVAGSGGTPTTDTIAVGRNCTATWKSKEAKAYGLGSNLIQARAKYEFEVEVKIGFIKFLPTITTWWPFYITNPASAGGTVADSNTVQLFTVTLQVNPLTTGNQKWLRTVSNVSFPEFPMEVPNTTDWIPVNLTGTGSTMVDSNPS